MCPACNMSNFESRSQCRQCGARVPTEVLDSTTVFLGSLSTPFDGTTAKPLNESLIRFEAEQCGVVAIIKVCFCFV